MAPKKCSVCHIEIKNHIGPHGKGKCGEQEEGVNDSATTMAEMAAEIKQLSSIVKKMQTQGKPEMNDSVHGATGDSLPGAYVKGQSYGEMFASKDPLTAVDPSDGGVFDPRITLCNKAQVKVVHITDFLSEKVKSRRRNKHRDFVLSTADESHTSVPVVVRSEDPHPYSGISLAEWNGANMRVMNHLLSIDQLPRSHVEYYLAYTAIVCDFYEKYEWESILAFDFQYRIQQATHNFN